MGMELKTPKSVIMLSIQSMLERAEAAILEDMKIVGEESNNRMRDGGNGKDYLNQTGNLRSSTGYCVLQDGKPVKTSSFPVVKDGAQGAADGRAFLDECAARFPKGIVLLLVAGMNYAVYVQRKGYDVIYSGQLYAENEVRKIVQRYSK